MDRIRAPASGAFQTKQAMVVQALRDAIRSGTLGPGTRLVIDEIARRLQVSPIPVREALHQLQSERLVEMKPHVGAVVTGVSPEEAQEIFALLEGLELACAGAACAGARPEDLARLRAEAEGMRAAAARSDADRWAELNARFHLALPRLAGMPRAQELMARVWGDWERLRTLRFPGAPRGDGGAQHAEHLGMVAALEARDPAALEELIRRHNRAAAASHLAGAPATGGRPAAS